MVTVSSTLALQDRMTGTLRSVTTALKSTFLAMSTIKGAELGPEFAQASEDIKRAELTLNDLDNEMMKFSRTVNSTGDGFTVLKGVAANALSFVGGQIKDVVLNIDDWIDKTTMMTARIGMINDGTQTTAMLQNDIFQAAQRSGVAYDLMADSVTKLNLLASDAFGSNKEALIYAELLGKSFAIANTDAVAMTGATRQLVQALGSGVLRGDELNSVFEAAPNIIQKIADYMSVPIGQIRAMAAEGQITADIVKNSMFAAANDINTEFERMPLTISQMWQKIQNEITMATQPFLQSLGEGARWVYENWETAKNIAVPAIAAIAITMTATFVPAAIKTAASMLGVTAATAKANAQFGIAGAALSVMIMNFGSVGKEGKFLETAIFGLATAIGVASIAVKIFGIELTLATAGISALIALVVTGLVALINWVRGVDEVTDTTITMQEEIDELTKKITESTDAAGKMESSILGIASTEYSAALQADLLSKKMSFLITTGNTEIKTLKQLSSMYNNINNLIPNFTKNLGYQNDAVLKTLSSLEGLAGIELEKAAAGLNAMTAETNALNDLSESILGVADAYRNFAYSAALVEAFQGKMTETAKNIAEKIYEKTGLTEQIEKLTLTPSALGLEAVAEQYEDLRKTLQAEKLDELIAATSMPVKTYKDLVEYAGVEQAEKSLAAWGISKTPEIKMPEFFEYKKQLDLEIDTGNRIIYESQLKELKLGMSEIDRDIAETRNSFNKYLDLALAEQEIVASFGDKFTPLIDNGAIKTRQQGEININAEDMKALLDLSTIQYKVNYNHTTPQMSINNVTINENVDGEALLNDIAIQFTEFANSDLSGR